MSHRARATFGVVVCVGLWPATARASPRSLEQGRQFYLEAKFDDAERSFLDLLSDPSATRVDLTEAYRHLAVIRLARGRAAAAQEAALRAVSLDPAVRAPEGAPAAGRALFEGVRAGVPSAGLAARVRPPADPTAGAPAEIEIEVDGDPGQLAAAANASCGGAQVRVPLPRGPAGSARANVDVGMGATPGPGVCTVQVLTASGAVLAEASVVFVAREPPPEPLPRATIALVDTTEAPPPPRRTPALTWLWVAVGATALVLGTYCVNDFVIYGSDRSGDLERTE